MRTKSRERRRRAWLAVLGWLGWAGILPIALGQVAGDPDAVQVGMVSATPATSLRLPLSDRLSYEIPAALGVTTTLAFPDAINDLHGAGFTRDPEVIGGDFAVQARPGERYLSVTPIKPDVVRNLNIVLRDGRIFALQFGAGGRDVEVPLTVFFEDVSEDAVLSEHPRITKSRKPPPNPFESSGAARILGALDTMKMLMALPGEVELRQAMDLMPGARLSVRDGEMTDYGTHAIVLDRVLRLDDKDILVFAVRILNRSDADILLDPEGFLIRVGDRAFQQVTADVAPRIRKGAGVQAFIAMIGSPDGTPNWLHPENDFRISVTLLQSGKPVESPPSGQVSVEADSEDDVKEEVAEMPPVVDPAPIRPAFLPRPTLDLQQAAFVPSDSPIPVSRPEVSSGVDPLNVGERDAPTDVGSAQSIPIQPLPAPGAVSVSAVPLEGGGEPAAQETVTAIEPGGAAVRIDEQISIRLGE